MTHSFPTRRSSDLVEPRPRRRERADRVTGEGGGNEGKFGQPRPGDRTAQTDATIGEGGIDGEEGGRGGERRRPERQTRCLRCEGGAGSGRNRQRPRRGEQQDMK